MTVTEKVIHSAIKRVTALPLIASAMLNLFLKQARASKQPTERLLQPKAVVEECGAGEAAGATAGVTAGAPAGNVAGYHMTSLPAEQFQAMEK